MRRGRAYWIFSKGGSNFSAPLSVAFDGTERLDFGHAVNSKPLTITNLSAGTVTVTIANPGNFPLVTSSIDAGTGLPAHLREVPEISRALQMTFAAVQPGDLSPEAGYSIRTGTYQETVTGLHKNAIVTTGTFTLRRLNTLGQINPPPAT